MTWRDGSALGLKSGVLALALLSGGCTTVIVENPNVNILVALPPFPTTQPLEHGAEPWPGEIEPPILRETH